MLHNRHELNAVVAVVHDARKDGVLEISCLLYTSDAADE